MEDNNRLQAQSPKSVVGEQQPDGDNQSYLTQISEQVKKLTGKLWETFANQETNVELQEKQQVYLSIARFLRDKLQAELPACFGAVYLLCQESDPRLLNTKVPMDEARQLVKSAQKMLIAIKVHYEVLLDFKQWTRQIEIFFINSEGKPAVSRVEEQVDWDNLSPDVREISLRDGKHKVSFKLYPQGE